MINTKKAFTLVELIVVITILAILGTIAFLSLQGYSWEARDAKRLTNVSDISKKISIEVAKGAAYSDFLSEDGDLDNNDANTGSTGYITTILWDAVDADDEMKQWTINFTALWENNDDFKDTDDDYVYAYAIGNATNTVDGEDVVTGYNFMQLATYSETNNTAVLVGNFYRDDTIAIGVAGADTQSLIFIDTDEDGVYDDGEEVTDGGSVLPY